MKITILMLMISISLHAQKYKSNPVAHKALGKVLLAIDNKKVSLFINKLQRIIIISVLGGIIKT